MKRRKFVETSLTSALAGYSINALSRDTQAKPPSKGMKILFQGDSITDAGRDRGNYYANQGSGMGGGYVYQVVSHLLGKYPESDLQCYNRGISGHKVFQLADRWDLDCLAIKPDVLSILIGVNDYWHMLNGRYDGTAQIYENDYRALLTRTKEALPNVKLIICEPFAVEGGTAINEKWGPFEDYRVIARKLAEEFNAPLVPFHSMFEEALTLAPAAYWCPDGVHPSIAGAHLMKDAWLKVFEGMM